MDAYLKVLNGYYGCLIRVEHEFSRTSAARFITVMVQEHQVVAALRRATLSQQDISADRKSVRYSSEVHLPVRLGSACPTTCEW